MDRARPSVCLTVSVSHVLCHNSKIIENTKVPKFCVNVSHYKVAGVPNFSSKVRVNVRVEVAKSSV